MIDALKFYYKKIDIDQCKLPSVRFAIVITYDGCFVIQITYIWSG